MNAGALSPDTALLALRFLRFGAAMVLWGSGVCLTVIAPAAVAARLLARMSLMLAIAVVVLAAVTALRLPLLAASFGNGWPDAARADVLAAVLQTRSGEAWIFDLTLCVALGATLRMAHWRRFFTAALAGLLLAVSALTGHATMPAGGWGIIHQLNDMVHLLASGFWLGALPALGLTLRHEDPGPEAVQTIERFGFAGQGAVALVVATGVANAVFIKAGSPLRWSSTYDALLALKLIVVFAMIGVASINHFRLLPRLTARSNGAAQALRRGALLEFALGLTAVGLVTVFGMLDAA
jgi:putative copper resistance protein D